MTTADYLESLQDDLSRTITALDLEEGTNFTDIADMAENGDISTGGGDISEYYDVEGSTMTNQNNNWAANQFVKKMPDLIVPTNIANMSLGLLFARFEGTKIPKVICGNNVTQMNAMYDYYGGSYTYAQRTSPITTLDISGLDMSNVITTESMFRYLNELTSLDTRNLNASKVTNAKTMFQGCKKLTTLDLSNFHIIGASGGGTTSMFSNCENLTDLVLNNSFLVHTDQNNQINIDSMFSTCKKLTVIDLSGFTITGKLLGMSGMFADCTLLTEINFGNNIKTDNVTNMANLFLRCTSLEKIDARSLSFSSVTSYSNMFGTSATDGPPDNCLIIVKDATQKAWINTNFSRLTNVQTVEEYEASLSS